ncbi:MAG: MCE family protein [Candidatus Eisenbacteria bacterium]|nr:MCE family protein [Candidatus Eisenbacteria bacterium]
MARKTEIQVGITLLLALGVLLWGVTWLKEFSLARKVRVWHVAFSQAGGLGKSDEVLVNGLRKGAVEDIRLAGDHVVVDLALASDVILTDQCRVAIRNIGLMGEKVIAVDMRNGGRVWAASDTIPGLFESGMGEVMAGLGGSIDVINRLIAELDRVSTMMSEKGELGETLRNFRDTSVELKRAVAENRGALRSTLANFEASSKTMKSLTSDKESEWRASIDHLSSAAKNMDVLAVRLDSLRLSMQNVVSKVDKGNGSLGKLVNDDKLYADMNASVQAIKDLLVDIKANPKKYLTVHIF